MHLSKKPSLKFVISLLLWVTLIPILSGYVSRATRKSQTAEAIHYVHQMALGAKAYYLNMQTQSPNLPSQFPETIGSTPMMPACQGGIPQAYNADTWADTWNVGSWAALHFHIDTSFYYRYSFISQGVGLNSAFTARAEGDLDCDGISSVYEITGKISDDGEVQLSLIWTEIFNEFE